VDSGSVASIITDTGLLVAINELSTKADVYARCSLGPGLCAPPSQISTEAPGQLKWAATMDFRWRMSRLS